MSPIGPSGGGSGPAAVSPSTVIQTGNGTPSGLVTPTHIGALYQELTSGALYIAVGATSATWQAVGGNATASEPPTLPGWYTDAFGNVYGLSAAGQEVFIGDVAGYEAFPQNGFAWNPDALAYGLERATLGLGSTGQFVHNWTADGSYAFPTTMVGPKWGLLSGNQEYQDTTALPADGGVATSRNVSSYDDTVGAPKMRWKRKDSGGTVFSGIVESASPITSGALPTVALASGTGAQLVVARAVESHTPVTFNPGVATTATVTVALSPDNSTYSTLCVITKPVGTVFDGEIEDVVVRVPAGWYIKLTVNAQATLGTTTYY